MLRKHTLFVFKKNLESCFYPAQVTLFESTYFVLKSVLLGLAVEMKNRSSILLNFYNLLTDRI